MWSSGRSVYVCTVYVRCVCMCVFVYVCCVCMHEIELHGCHITCDPLPVLYQAFYCQILFIRILDTEGCGNVTSIKLPPNHIQSFSDQYSTDSRVEAPMQFCCYEHSFWYHSLRSCNYLCSLSSSFFLRTHFIFTLTYLKSHTQKVTRVHVYLARDVLASHRQGQAHHSWGHMRR